MATFATLADSFLADFESDGDEEEEEEQQQVKKEEEVEVGDDGEAPEFDDDVGDDEFKDLDEDIEEEEEELKTGIEAISTYLTNAKFVDHMKSIDAVVAETETDLDTGEVKNELDRELEDELIVKSNEIATEIDTEIANIHKFARDLYAPKFQELESIVVNPLEYCQVVKIIGNETDITLVEGELLAILPQHIILTISVTATTTIGKPLPPEELQKAFDACDAIIQLDDHKRKLFLYIESRMSLIAPNLSQIIGSDVTARLIGLAGGLEPLSKIPACNLQVLGTEKKAAAGFSSATQGQHMGILARTVIIQSTPMLFRARAMRLLSGKCGLASKIDLFREDPDGEQGRKLLEVIVKKLQKWQEPPPPKIQKALAAPLQEYRKKRGGRRKRKEKEKYKTTQLQKTKNRMPFGKEELTDDYTGEGLGMIGLAGSGRLAIKKKEKQHLKKKLSRKMQARLRRVPGSGLASATPGTGTASSIAFTPVQGIELVAGPDALREQAQTAGRYFSSGRGFLRVGKGSMLPPPSKKPKI